MSLYIVADSLLLGVLNGCLYALICVGIAMIFGVVGVVNFAHAELMMVAAYIVVFLTSYFGASYSIVAIAIAVPLVGALGFAFDRVVLRQVRKSYGSNMRDRELSSLVGTMGMSFLLANGMFLLVGPDYVRVPRLVRGSTTGFLIGIPNQLIVAAIIAAAVIMVLFWILHRTNLGRAIRAVRDQPDIVESFGINRERIFATAFGMAAALAGLAGTLLGPIHYVYPYMGSLYLIKAFVITVLAGLGSIQGVLVAAVGLAMLESIGTTFYSAQVGNMVFFVAMVVFLLFRPYGLFGKGEVVK